MESSATTEQQEGENIQVLQEPPPLAWTGTELSSFLYRDPKSSTCGLRNLGNTCYLNSVLQALAHIPVLSTFLNVGFPMNAHSPGSGSTQMVANQARRDFCHFLARTNAKMWSGEFKDFAPRNVNRTMIDTVPEFSHNGQQDAEEALTYILNNLHDELYVPVPKEVHPARQTIARLEKERLQMLDSTSATEGAADTDRIAQAYDPYKRSIVSDAFQSLIAQRVTCESCKQTSLTLQECLSFPLELPTAVAATPAATAVAAAPLNSSPRMSPPSKVLSKPSQEISPLTSQPPPLPMLPAAPGFFGVIKGLFFGSSPGANAPPLDLEDCLKSFFSPEVLRGEDQYYCSKCKCKVDANKTLELAHLPQVLCIQLKRFNIAPGGNASSSSSASFTRRSLFSRDSGGGSKNFTMVRFPVDTPLDLGAFLRPSEEDAMDTEQQQQLDAKYKLVCVVRHSGSATYGHYVAQCRTPDDKWFTFDDELVTPTNENGLFQDAYLLMYERLPSNEERAKKQEAIAKLSAFAAAARKAEDDTTAYVSREWAIKFETMCSPGPIDNLCLQCPHALFAFPASKNMNERVVALPQLAYNALEQLYGSRHPQLSALRACEECKICHLEREQRRAAEQRWVTAPIPSPTEYVCIPKPWYQSWLRFVNNDCGPLGRGAFEGAPPPGPIPVHQLLTPDHSAIRANLKYNVHYVSLPLQVFFNFYKTYGTTQGEIPIVRATQDIFSEARAWPPVEANL